MTRSLTEEEQREPGTALAKLLGRATVYRLTEEESLVGVELLRLVRMQAVDEAIRIVEQAA